MITLFVAFAGVTVATSVCILPSCTFSVVGFNATPVTDTVASTDTSTVATFPPSTVVAVMVAVPKLAPYTIPFTSTVAILELLERQINSLLLTFTGVNTGTNALVLPTPTVMDVAPKLKLDG
ncbi:hypothetical protein D3C85_1544100 [compost metagenome]